MKSLPNSTNGVLVLSDSFATAIFKQSFLRVFDKDEQGDLQMGFNATFDVQVCTRNLSFTKGKADHHLRLLKSSKSLDLLDMQSLQTKSPVVWGRPRLVSDRRQPGKFAASHHAHLPPSTLRSSHQLDSRFKQALAALFNS